MKNKLVYSVFFNSGFYLEFGILELHILTHPPKDISPEMGINN